MTGNDRPLPPGSTIGILGGGQLGRMLALAAAPLGLKCHIFAPEPDSPAFEVAAARTVANYDDGGALERFAATVDAVTFEFENVPASAVDLLAGRLPVRPNGLSLATAQDRVHEKQLAREIGATTADFAIVDNLDDLRRQLVAIPAPCVLKTRRFGYDGKGQVKVASSGDAAEAYAAIGGKPAILEAFVAFRQEVSIVAARGLDGTFVTYDVTANSHRDHILDRSTAPAELPSNRASEAIGIAHRIADRLGYVGVFAIEFFVVDGAGGAALLFNEMAPRVHNSGHWTIEGAVTSQFEQHMRAVAGWPLGATDRLAARVEMTNLIGTDADRWTALAAEAGAHLHLYGKSAARAGRKMGHVTRLFAAAGSRDR